MTATVDNWKIEHKTFRLLAKTTNRDALGLARCVLVARDGTGIGICSNDLCMPDSGRDYELRKIAGEWAGYERGWELTKTLTPAPQAIVDALYGRQNQKEDDHA